jgi:hypothetical protein
MVVCNRVSTEAYVKIYNDDDDDDDGVTHYLGLVDIAIKPHLGSKLFPKNCEEVLLEVTKSYEGTVYGLADD